MISFLNRYYKGRYLIFIPVIISLTIEQQLQHEKIRLEIDIEECVAEYVSAKLYENDFDAEIIGVVISGSRCRGLEGKNSDLDVVVQLSGNEREDDLFNLLHEDKFRIGGVLVDINPITEYKTGTLEEYLPGVEKYLEEKAMQMGKKLSVTADLQSKKMQVAGEKKKETKRDCKKSETVI